MAYHCATRAGGGKIDWVVFWANHTKRPVRVVGSMKEAQAITDKLNNPTTGES